MTFQESDDKPQGLPDYRYLKLDLFFDDEPLRTSYTFDPVCFSIFAVVTM